MEDKSWKEEYKEWKKLEGFKQKILDEGPQTQSQAWLINQMWSEWSELKKQKIAREAIRPAYRATDPWDN